MQTIISNRDAHYTKRLWKVLFAKLGTQLHFSTTYHPQTSDQIEHLNVMLEEYLRHYVLAKQDNQMKLLDSAQLAYNLQCSNVIYYSLFELATNYQPLMSLQLLDVPRKCHIDTMLVEEHRIKNQVNRHRCKTEFQLSDKMLLQVNPEICQCMRDTVKSQSLLQRFEGPFTIIE